MQPGEVVLITGASSGIGLACAEAFSEAKATLLLLARREDRLHELKERLSAQHGNKILTHALDVRDADAVANFVASLDPAWRDIGVLVNNAGLSLSMDKLQDGAIANFERMIDTNVKGLLYMTRAVLPLMIAKNSGHIVNIGSIAGHECYPGGNVYAATKHAVRALTKSLALDLLGTKIRVTSIDPGAVETEFSLVRFGDADRASKVYADFTPLSGRDVAEAVLWSTLRPAHVNVAEMILFPTDQRSANHIHRGGRNIDLGKVKGDQA